MKKLFLLMLSFAFGMLIVSCGDSKSDNDNEVTPDESTDTVVKDDAVAVDDAAEATDDVVPDDVVPCTLEDTFLDPIEGYDAYFAFHATGVINDGTDAAATPTDAFKYKLSLVLPEHPARNLKTSSRAFWQANVQNGSETIELIAMGDPGTQYYGTFAIAVFDKAGLQTLKAQFDADPTVEPVADGAPTVQIYELTELTGMLKQCVVAISDIDTATNTAPGKTKLCSGANVDFSLDEIMKAAVNAKVTEDVDKILTLFGETDPAALCSCFETTSGNFNTVDCPGTVVPDDDVIVTDEMLTDN